MNSDQQINREIRIKTIRSFAIFFVLIGLAVFGWMWLRKQPSNADGTRKTLRAILDANETVNEKFFSDNHLAPVYPRDMAVKKVRVNGDLGMNSEFNPDEWKLHIVYHRTVSADTIMELTMNDIKSFPKTEIIFDFKCIEGWSQITHWGGTKFSDFLIKYKLGTHSGNAPDFNHPEDLFKYVGLITPDSEYYVGIDMKSILHPQTILCYEMNGAPLPVNQGYPLRLIIPVKYGVKHLKRIGTIFFSDTRPPDYWYEQGYDYDSAL